MKVLYKTLKILNKSQKRRGFIVCSISFLGALLELIGIASILPFIQVVLATDSFMKQSYVIKICSVLGIHNSKRFVLILGIFLMLVYILKNISLFCIHYLQVTYSNDVEKEIALSLMKSYLNYPYSFFVNTNSSELVRNVHSDTLQFGIVLQQIYKVLSEIFVIVLIGIALLKINFEITLLIAIFLLVEMLLYWKIIKGRIKKAGEENIEGDSNVYRWLLQTFGSIKEIMVFNKKEYFYNKYEINCKKFVKAHRDYLVLERIPTYLFETVCIIALIGTICIEIFMNKNMTEIMSVVSVFAVAAVRLLPSASRIEGSISTIIYYSDRIDNIYTNIQKEPITEERDFNVQNNIVFNEKIELKNISWAYSNNTKIVLDNINIQMEKGKAIAIIGKSGAGKTTLADILLGLYVPEQGGIYIDGERHLFDKNAWLKLVGYVPQQPYILDDTILNNVAFGVPDALIDQERVWEVIKQAQIYDFVKGLEDGILTIMGERGVKFSGGQKQRISIARALYHNPEIIILDEATSALDSVTEEHLMKTIELLHGEKTLVIIAHRLSTIEKCDVVYEIKKGKIQQVNK